MTDEIAIKRNFSQEQVRLWLLERADNAVRIADTKAGADREGWLEDAAYFLAASALIAKLGH